MNVSGENRLLEFCKINKRLVIYGAGKYGAAVEKFCRERDVSIYCFCVTQIDEKETFLGYTVKEIAEIRKNFSDVGVIVAVSEKFSGEVLEKVKGLHYFYDKCLLQDIDADNAMKKAKECVKLVEIKDNTLYSVGEFLFCDDIFYIVCPGSIGDTLYIASLVKAFKCKNKLHSVV